MFTKYTNMKLPQNYSGSRFKPATEDTEMKTHRAKDTGTPINNVKTSVSPYFQSSFVNEQSYSFEPQEDRDTYETDVDVPTQQEETNEDVSTSTHATLKELTRLFAGIKSDDLLLLALIILFASDSGQNSVDTIVILALLLLS